MKSIRTTSALSDDDRDEDDAEADDGEPVEVMADGVAVLTPWVNRIRGVLIDVISAVDAM